MTYLLLVTYPSGYVAVKSYPDVFSRALELIVLSAQPSLVLTVKDY